MEREVSNYDVMAEQARIRFLTFDQNTLIEKLALACDSQFIYLTFVNQPYRIYREDGTIFKDLSSGFQKAGHHEVLAIYDMLCHGTEHPVLSGTWESLSSLGGIIGAGHSNSTMLNRYISAFEGKTSALADACRALGGTPRKNGDVSFLLPVFDFFPTWFQFWDGDEEYPASIRFLWDKHTLRYLHYETLWYIMVYILEQLQSLCP